MVGTGGLQTSDLCLSGNLQYNPYGRFATILTLLFTFLFT